MTKNNTGFLSRFSITKKLLALLFISLIAPAFLTYTLVEYSQTTKQINALTSESNNKVQSLATLQSDLNSSHMLLFRMVNWKLGKMNDADIQKTVAQFTAIMAKMPVTMEKAGASDEIKTLITAYGTSQKLVVQNMSIDDFLMNMTMNDAETAYSKANNTLLAFKQQTEASVSEQTSGYVEKLDAEYNHALMVAFVCIIFSIISISSLIKHITGRLSALMRPLESMMKDDYAVTIPDQSAKDEIGSLARTLEKLRCSGVEAQREADEKLNEQMVKEHRQMEIARLVHHFEESADKSVKSVSHAADVVRSTSEAVSSTAEQNLTRTRNVSGAADLTVQNINTVASATEELSVSGREIAEQVQRATSIVASAVQTAEKTQIQIDKLSQQVGSISGVLDVVKDIAHRTNLLALNATIESARAGEMGKGFAVVASEVKDLAGQTAKAVEGIQDQIEDAQKATIDAVESIKTITSVIGSINQTTMGISAAVEEQGSATAEIARSVQQAAELTQGVTRELAEVTQAMSETEETSRTALAQAGELQSQSAFLKTEIEKFITGVKGSEKGSPNDARAMAEQAAALVAEKKEDAFDAINNSARFHDRDLYVFVYDPKGICVAHGAKPDLIGKNLIALKDKSGFEMIRAIVETRDPRWIDFTWNNPLTGETDNKSSYVINVGNQYYVGVGIYK